MNKLDTKCRASRGLTAALAAFTLCVCTGCPTGSYRQQMQERGNQVAQTIPGDDQLWDYSQIGQSPLWIRVPLVFKRPLVKDGGQKIQRRQPLVIPPGLEVAWEGDLPHEGSLLPFYCYLAVTDADPTKKILDQLNQISPDHGTKWENYKDRSGKTWKKLRLNIEQDWIPLSEGSEEGTRVEGTALALTGMLEFDCRQEGPNWVIVGWSVPQAIEGQANLNKVIDPTLSSLEAR